ncbi:MAG: LSU ribosomal protein L13p (L13Ae), partial [uncultured Thermomicrobiales bacterium]
GTTYVLSQDVRCQSRVVRCRCRGQNPRSARERDCGDIARQEQADVYPACRHGGFRHCPERGQGEGDRQQGNPDSVSPSLGISWWPEVDDATRCPCSSPGADHRECREGHAAAEHAWQAAVQEAQGVYRNQSPARRTESAGTRARRYRIALV